MTVLWWVSRQKCSEIKHCSRGRTRTAMYQQWLCYLFLVLQMLSSLNAFTYMVLFTSCFLLFTNPFSWVMLQASRLNTNSSSWQLSCTPTHTGPHRVYAVSMCEYVCCVLSCFSGAWLFATPWTVACQAPLSTGFSRQLEGVTIPFSRGPLWSRDQTQASCVSWIAGKFFTCEL